MQKPNVVPQVLAAVLLLAPCFSIAMAADQPAAAKDQPAAAPSDEPVCGWDLMTPEERAEHRAKMRSLKTAPEREAYRAEQHAKMEERAKQQGKTLPSGPPCGPRGGMMRGPGSGGRMMPGGGY